jgi:hypothetical protein
MHTTRFFFLLTFLPIFFFSPLPSPSLSFFYFYFFIFLFSSSRVCAWGGKYTENNNNKYIKKHPKINTQNEPRLTRKYLGKKYLKKKNSKNSRLNPED